MGLQETELKLKAILKEIEERRPGIWTWWAKQDMSSPWLEFSIPLQV